MRIRERMCFWKKAYDCFRQHLFLILLLQLLISLLIGAGAFVSGNTRGITFTPEDFSEQREDGKTVLESAETELSGGIYRAVLDYSVDQDCTAVWNLSAENAPYGSLKGNTCMLYQGLKRAEMLVWVSGRVPNAAVKITVPEGTELQLGQVCLYRTGLGWTWLGIQVLLFFALLDIGYLIFRKKTDEKALLGVLSPRLILVLVFLISSLPLLGGYVIAGADTVYHLLRIEGLREGLLSGQFPVRIQPGWLQGHGYATGLFYCDTYLYLPALLRILGMPMGAAYLLYKLIINALTVWLAYSVFLRMFRDRWIAVMGSMLYTLNIYRLICLYLKDHLGQYTAMAFLPLLACGIYRLLSEDAEAEAYRRLWIPLAGAGTLLIQCHVLTCELVALFLIPVLLICYRRTFRKETLWEILKAAAAATLINLWFLVPFLQSMMREPLNITGEAVYTRTIQSYGSLIPQLLGVFHFAGGSDRNMEGGMQGEIPFGTGIALIWILICYLAWRFGQRGAEKIEETGGDSSECCARSENSGMERLGDICAGFGLLTLWMSTVVFPWDKIQSIGGPVGKLVSALQYPTRILEMAVLFLSILSCILIRSLLREGSEETRRIVSGITIAAVLVPTLLFLDDLMVNAPLYFLYDNHGMGNSYLSGKEYLPSDTDESLLKEGKLNIGDGIEITDYEKNAIRIDMHLENSLDESGYVEVPLLYYEGYTVCETVPVGTAGEKSTGKPAAAEGADMEKPRLCAGENHVIRILVPANYRGDICVAYRSSGLWRACEIISLLALLCFGAAAFAGYCEGQGRYFLIRK